MSGLWGLLFGSDKPAAVARNTVNIVADQSVSIVNTATNTCEETNGIFQIQNFNGCTLRNVTVRQGAKTHYNVECFADINLSSTTSQDMQLQVLQDAQATAIGLGMVAAEAINIVNESLSMSTAIVNTVNNRMSNSRSIMQVFNCENSSLDSSFFNFYAEIGSNAKSVLNARSVVNASSNLASTVSQTAVATSKDLFGQLAELGGLALMATAIVLVALIAGGSYVVGKTATTTVSSLFTSPYLWLAIPTAFLVINSVLFFRNSPYYKAVVPNQEGKTNDPIAAAVKRDNLNLYLATTIPTAAMVGVLGVYIAFQAIRGGKK